MQHARSLRRSVFLALSLLSACAASGPGIRTGEAASSPYAGPEPATSDFLIGRFAGQHGDLRRAANAFMRALAQDPGDPQLQQQAFLACLLTDRPQAERLARTQLGDPVAELYLADVAAQENRWTEAQRRFAGLPQEGLTKLMQPLLIAWTQAGGGRADLAVATLQAGLSGERAPSVYILHAALIADLAHRDPQAARLYQRAAAVDQPQNLELARALASFAARNGDRAAATRILQAQAGVTPELTIALPALLQDAATPLIRNARDGLAETYLAAAADLHGADQPDQAALLLQLALQLRPDLTAARLLDAELDQEARRPADALALLAPVEPGDPLAALVDLRRATLLTALGRRDEALALLTRLQQAFPDQSEPWVLQGSLLREAGEATQAVAAYDHAVALVPNPGRDNWALFYARGIALEQAHRWPQAQADFQHALALSPDQPYVLNYLGYAWTERGEHLDEARHMIERAVALRPQDGAIIDSLGWVELRQGDVTDAVHELEHAVELEPEDATINGHLGDAYRAAHRPLEAGFQWHLALALKPDPDEAAALQKKLREIAPAQQAAKASP